MANALPKGERDVMSIWRIVLWIAAILVSLGAAALLVMMGIRLWLARRAGSQRPPRHGA
jgi:hypothetical protein